MTIANHTPKDLGSTTSPNFLEKVKETLSVLLGNRGDGDSRALTVRDLQDSGLLGSTIVAKAQAAASSASSSNTTTIINTVVVKEPDLTPPPMPTGFSVSAAISNIVVTCDAQGYTEGNGHSKSILYGTTYTSGSLPVFSNALILTEFAGSVFSYSTNPATTWRLWLKWMSVDGVLSSNPAGGINGLAATTGQNVTALLTALSGQIRATELEAALGTRINLVDGNGVGSVNARVGDEAIARAAAITNEATNRATAITNEATARATAITNEATARGAAITTETNARQAADSSLSSSITTLTASVATNAAAISTEQTARANADSAIVNTATTLAARVTTAEGGITTNAAAITTEATARANADTAESNARTTLAARVTTTEGGINTNAAAIQTEATARANADSAIVSTATTLAARVTTAEGGITANAAALTTEASARASADSAIVNTATTLAARVTTAEGGITTNAAAITTEATARAAADTAEATARTTLAARVTTAEGGITANTAAITTEANARANADSAIVSSATTLAARVTTAEGGIATNAAAITTEATARANADTAETNARTTLAARVTTAEGGISTNAAAITTEASARASADSAITSNVTTLSSAVGTNTAAIQTEATTRASETAGLYAQYTVKLDVGGKVSGFGLASTNSASAFAIRADRFYISPPATGGGTATEIIPFIVQASATTINGVNVPAGVYMDTAFIKDGTITNVKIGNAAIDDAKITTLSASKLVTGTVSVGQEISSSNYVAGSAGWKIAGTGGAEFSGVTVRGAIYATSGTIGGNAIDYNAIRAGQSALNTGTGFYLGSNGTFSVGQGGVKGMVWDGSNINIASPGFTLINGVAKLSGELNIGAMTGYAWPTSGTGAHIGPSGFIIGNYNGFNNTGANTGRYFQIALGNTAGSEAIISTNIPAYLADLQVTTLKINNNSITYSASSSNSSFSFTVHPPSTLMIVGKAILVGHTNMGIELYVAKGGSWTGPGSANSYLLDTSIAGGGGHYVGLSVTVAGAFAVPVGQGWTYVDIIIYQIGAPQQITNFQITVLEVQK